MTAVIEIHPLALEYPPLSDDEMQSLAQSIAANGQRDPITLDQQGRVVEGRNRLEACGIAGVDPLFETREFADDDEIADFILDRNVERRSLSNGQRAMFRAANLARQGKRQNGRWKRDTIKQDFALSDVDANAVRVAMGKAGLVLDVAARATQLGPDFAVFSDQPTQVKAGTLSLDAAHRIAQDFESKAAMAEMALWLPFTKAAGQLEQLSIEAESATELPVVDVPLKKAHRAQLEDTAKRFAATAAAIRTYLKENK